MVMTSLCPGIKIRVDYRLDQRGFFDDPLRRLVMEAAAARWGRIIDQALLPVNMTDGQFIDGRFEIFHPETGEPYVFSAAAGPATDYTFQRTGQPVDEYLNGFTLEADELIVFVGSRPLAPPNLLGSGGVIGGGNNLVSVYEDPKSFLNRGFNVGTDSLEVLGGFITFDADREWNFDLTSVSGENGGIDFYSVALHELGHTLGLNTRAAKEWTDLVSGGRFTGQESVAAYNADNGTNRQQLDLLNPAAGDQHWPEERYTSKIFPLGEPLLVATVGSEGMQELLMEPAFRPAAKVRLEVTNVDAASLKDIGWSIIDRNPPRPPVLPVALVPSPTGALGLGVTSEAGAVYTIQTSPDGISWLDVNPSLVGDGSFLSWTDGEEGFTDPFGQGLNLGKKYFRVRKD